MKNAAFSALQTKGFRKFGPVRVRLDTRRGLLRGLVIWQQGGATLFAGAQLPLRLATKLLIRLCKLANAPQRSRRLKARKTLRMVLKDARPMLRGSIVSGHDSQNDAAWRLAEHLIAEVGMQIQEREQGVEVGRKRKRKRKRVLRRAVNKLSKRVAKNRVLTKLRRSYASVLKGRGGKLAASGAAKALMLLGIPPEVTETILRARMNRRADRQRKGGWSGVLSRTTDDQGSMVRNLLQDEGRRLLHGYQRQYEERNRGRRRPAPSQEPDLYDDPLFAAFEPSDDTRIIDRGVPFVSESELDRLIGAAEIGEVGALLDELGEPYHDGLQPHAVQDLTTCV